MDGRAIECARGKVVGGSSSINAMAYVRGHRGDYDRWAASGLAGMVLCARAALFPAAGKLGGRRQRISRRRRAARDAALPLSRSAGRRLHRSGRSGGPSAHRRITTARSRKASAALQMTIRNGRRCSAAVAYLRPALARGQSHRRGRARWRRRIVLRGRARRRHRISARRRAPDRRAAEREVILCRRRDQLAAASDAVGHRRSGGARGARHRR